MVRKVRREVKEKEEHQVSMARWDPKGIKVTKETTVIKEKPAQKGKRERPVFKDRRERGDPRGNMGKTVILVPGDLADRKEIRDIPEIPVIPAATDILVLGEFREDPGIVLEPVIFMVGLNVICNVLFSLLTEC